MNEPANRLPSRREFLMSTGRLAVVSAFAGVALPQIHAAAQPLAATAAEKPKLDSARKVSLTSSSPTLQLKLEAEIGSAHLTKLGWDTEGTGRANINLLRSPVELRLSKQGRVLTPPVRFTAPDPRTIRYEFSLEEGRQLAWKIAVRPDGLRMRVSCSKNLPAYVDKLELVFPFEPKTAVASIISSRWTADGRFEMPAIINAPDLGQMLVKCSEHPKLTGRIEGSRTGKWLTMTFELPIPSRGSAINLEFSPVVLPMPAGFKDEKRWKAARRGWFNLNAV